MNAQVQDTLDVLVAESPTLARYGGLAAELGEEEAGLGPAELVALLARSFGECEALKR